MKFLIYKKCEENYDYIYFAMEDIFQTRFIRFSDRK